MLRPMLLLAIDVAILDAHTGLTCLETNAPRNATIGTAEDIISIMVHDGTLRPRYPQ